MLDRIKEKLCDYKEAIIANGIYDIIKKIAGILLGETFITTLLNIGIDALNITFVKEYKIYIVIVVGLATLIFFLEVYDRAFKHKPILPEVVGDYDIIRREVTFTYGRDCSKYELYLAVKSNIKGLNRLKGKYTWSGSDPATIKCVTRHCKIIPLARKDAFIEYEVELRKNFRKGARVECRLEGDMPDSKHTFVPFFSTRITEYTHELILNICIPPEYNVREIICEELPIVRGRDVESTIQQLDADGKYQWVIPRPKLFYVYSVRWEL